MSIAGGKTILVIVNDDNACIESRVNLLDQFRSSTDKTRSESSFEYQVGGHSHSVLLTLKSEEACSSVSIPSQDWIHPLPDKRGETHLNVALDSINAGRNIMAMRMRRLTCSPCKPGHLSLMISKFLELQRARNLIKQLNA
jgi:hypothetical protein